MYYMKYKSIYIYICNLIIQHDKSNCNFQYVLYWSYAQETAGFKVMNFDSQLLLESTGAPPDMGLQRLHQT